MSRYQNPYIYRTSELGFLATSRRTHQTLGDHRTQVSTTFWSNGTGQGARGELWEASHPVPEAEGWPEEPHITGQGHNEATVVTHPTLPPPPPLEDPLGEFPSLRHVHWVKPHQKRCPIAWAMPGFDEPLAAPPPHRPHLSCPRFDQWPRLDHRYPFIFIKIRASKNEATAQINLTFFCWKIIQ
jgi:hypothetical protein